MQLASRWHPASRRPDTELLARADVNSIALNAIGYSASSSSCFECSSTSPTACEPEKLTLCALAVRRIRERRFASLARASLSRQLLTLPSLQYIVYTCILTAQLVGMYYLCVECVLFPRSDPLSQIGSKRLCSLTSRACADFSSLCRTSGLTLEEISTLFDGDKAGPTIAAESVEGGAHLEKRDKADATATVTAVDGDVSKE